MRKGQCRKRHTRAEHTHKKAHSNQHQLVTSQCNAVTKGRLLEARKVPHVTHQVARRVTRAAVHKRERTGVEHGIPKPRNLEYHRPNKARRSEEASNCFVVETARRIVAKAARNSADSGIPTKALELLATSQLTTNETSGDHPSCARSREKSMANDKTKREQAESQHIVYTQQVLSGPRDTSNC